MSMNSVFSGKPSKETLEYLQKRRSCPLKMMGDKGPDEDEIGTILRIAARVPDHGKLFPWYFIVFTRENRKKAGALLREAWLTDNPDAAPAKLELEAARFMRAPVVIAVVSRIKRGKHPQWEQILSAGAVCQNLCLAANSMGYGTNWLTEWYAYSDHFKTAMGLDAQDHFAGFIYIGETREEPDDRPRPDINDITTYWDGAAPHAKGAAYDHGDQNFPRARFAFVTNDGDTDEDVSG